MLPVASARPLWWLARWATRLLTGFAVAAAFTIGAWALPAQGAPAGQFATVAASAGQFTLAGVPVGQLAAAVSGQPPAGAVVPQSPTGWELAATNGSADTASVAGGGDHVELGDVPGTPATVPARPHVPDAGVVAAADASAPGATVPGADTARAPPRF